MSVDIKLFSIDKNDSVKQAMRQMKQISQKELFVTDEKDRLFGVLSDGDIRRWILSEGSLLEKILRVCNQKPVTMAENYDLEQVKKTMLDLKIEAIPVINSRMEIVEILVWDEVFSGKVARHREVLDIPVVIMAGGKGTRLDPFTRILPKSLIPIGDKPIVEIIIDRFGEYGIREFYLSINHKSKMVKSYFEEMGGKYDIRYIEEEMPLGTAGSLRLLQGRIESPFLVTNCDIIIESDYGELVRFHKEKNYDMTMVVSSKHYVIPYGVCEIINGGLLKSIKEKPEYDLLVNTGMYVLKTGLIDLIPKNKFFNINDLMAKAKEAGCRIGVFPISENSWIDIGQWEEYQKAVKKLKSG